MSSLDPGVVGCIVLVIFGLVTVVGGVLGILVAVKKLNEPRPAAEQAATRSELEKVQNALARFSTKEEMSELKSMLTDLEKYVQSRFHDLANALNPLPVKLEIVLGQYQKLESKIDTLMMRQEHMIMARDMHLNDAFQATKGASIRETP